MSRDDDAADDPNIGRIVADRYRISGIIAQGGMGKVYRGEHVHMRNQVAIKLLKADAENLPELVARFERESIVGAHARHENVGMATDFGKDTDGAYYLVMEYIEGRTLRSVIDDGPLPQARAVDIALQIAHGLDAIHELDIVHRDLNPRNVMLAEDDLVKLIDFGFARVPLENFEGSDDTMSITTMGEVFGTIGFIAPEAAFGMVAVDKPADLYALGVIFYEMLTGKHPFDAKGNKQLFRAHTEEEPQPPSTRFPQQPIAPTLEAIIMRLLQKSPNDRYESALDVADAVEAAMEKLGVAASDRPLPSSKPPAPRSEAPPRSEPESSPFDDDPPVVPLKKNWPLRFAILLLIGGGAAVAAVPSLRNRVLALTRSAPAASATASASVTAPSATPSSSAKATPSATPKRPTAVDGVDAEGWQKTLRGAVGSNDITRGTKAIRALAEIDPKRLLDPAVRRDAAAVATTTAMGDQKRADALFELLSSEKIGPGGPDILLRLVTHHGGSRGAKRAAELLAKPEVLKRGSDAMQIAYEMRSTACGERGALFERAIAKGDHRVLEMLNAMDAPTCVHTCCMRYNSDLDEARRLLGKRLR